MEFIQEIRMEIERLESQIHSIHEFLRQAPDGTLSINRNGHYYKWYRRRKRGSRVIRKKERPLAEALAYNTYLQAKIKELCAEKDLLLEYLTRLEQIDPADDLLRPDSLYRPLILPQLDSLTKELEEWKEAPYEQFEKYQTNKVNRSVSGNSYRSKSEAFIASMLDQYHIPYHYEEVRDINGRPVAVDFTIRHPRTGQTFLWEHFGLLDDDGYVNDNLGKIYDYVKAGWIPMANLIVTCENKEHPLDFRLVHSLIKHFFIDG